MFLGEVPCLLASALEVSAAADFSIVPGTISTGDPIARAPEAVGRAVGPGAVRVVLEVHRRGRGCGYHRERATRMRS